MIYRILCLLFGHVSDIDMGNRMFLDVFQTYRIMIIGCERCGCIYIKDGRPYPKPNSEAKEQTDA